jgi:response regulator of citrate/malate metabolism
LRRRTWFLDARELIHKHQPDVLLIEPFLEDRDGILWIKELAKGYPQRKSAAKGGEEGVRAYY